MNTGPWIFLSPGPGRENLRGRSQLLRAMWQMATGASTDGVDGFAEPRERNDPQHGMLQLRSASGWICSVHRFTFCLSQAWLRLFVATPASRTYEQFQVSACEQATQWGQAVQLLADIHSKGIYMDGSTTCSVLSACVKAQHLRESTSVLNLMRRNAVEGSTIACSAAIGACSHAGLWHLAAELLDYMAAKQVPRNIITFSSAISSCAKAGQWTGSADPGADVVMSRGP